MLSFSEQILIWLESVLEERFGHHFILVKTEDSLVLRLPGDNREIVFDRLQSQFYQSKSDIPHSDWDAASEGWQSVLEKTLPAPAANELPSPLIEVTTRGYSIHYDILGLTYWMLTRLEEVGRTDLDVHGRFPATSSHAHLYCYLDRPVVDEWLAVLKQVIQRQWPNLNLKEHEFRMCLSHDVDRPSRYGFRKLGALIKAMGGDVMRGRFKVLFLAPWIRLNNKTELHSLDPYNTFDWIMDQSEAQGIRSAFYFICGRTNSKVDADYDIDHRSIRQLMRRIHQRGHEIGMHPSYNSYQNPISIHTEVNRLRAVCTQEGIQQSDWGGRMHYLRWEQPTTLNACNDADMNYDSTLTYADNPGFRCGTCYEYPAFDPVAYRALHIRVRPLIAMDASVLSAKYQGFSPKNALKVFLDLKEKCKKVEGRFTLLWHNSELNSFETRMLYKRILEGL